MPYVIAIVVLLVGAIAFFALRSPAEAPAQVEATPVEAEAEVAPDTIETIPAVPEDTAEPTVAEPEPVTAAPAQPAQTPEPVAATQTLSAEASYLTPRRTNHDIDVTLTLEGTTITAANITYDGGTAVTPSHGAFDATYQAAVIGKDINTVNLSRVGGASLTSDAFNDAVVEIRAQL